MAGNKLGSKDRYVYKSDEPNTYYIIQRDIDLAVAGTGDGAASPVLASTFTVPSGSVICPPPKGFSPRKVNIIDRADGSTKGLICFSPTANLYAANSGSQVTIDTVDFVTTGRSGEKLTF